MCNLVKTKRGKITIISKLFLSLLSTHVAIKKESGNTFQHCETASLENPNLTSMKSLDRKERKAEA